MVCVYAVAPMRVLLVKTSSMGDVIHNLPVVADIRARYPYARIDWLVEEAFADIPRLNPGVERVIPVALRRWRRQLLRPAVWREMAAFRRRVWAHAYDVILDTQGLIKSALLARLAQGAHVGYCADCAREPLAARFYDRCHSVDAQAHAVVRYRALAAAAFALPADLPLDYGLPRPAQAPSFAPEAPYGVLLTATSRREKLWPEAHWVALGHALVSRGFGLVLPWGSLAEYERARRIADQLPGTIPAPRLTLTEAAALLAHARLVVGVDTGLAHLATAVGTPTIGLYGGSDPRRNGLYATTPVANLGVPGRFAQVSEVLAVVDTWLGRGTV
ncbi:lipopolysaccharide heptosyltransferase I [Thiobacter aerophilum]|uniref:Lipopolysaccharide heptosyltransferase 1 n=1 Tax=Thiobacter aerophilum TaxID=3121275 RepID=A0ABV0EGD0_9BURK